MSAMEAQAAETWDPSLLDNINPTKECLSRIRQDIKALQRDPLPGIYCICDEVIVTKFHALIVGPFDTPYEGGFFYFTLNVPENYPHAPPKVRLQTTGAGSVRFNPNLYANGKVCLSILGTWSGPSWESVQSLSSVLLSIQSLMTERPYHNEPGFEAPNAQNSQNYNDCIRHETLRVAVCDMVSPTSSTAALVPPPLREVMCSLFPSFVDSYELICLSQTPKDGQEMIDPFGEKRGRFCFAKILEKLQSIKADLGVDEDEEDECEVNSSPT